VFKLSNISALLYLLLIIIIFGSQSINSSPTINYRLQSNYHKYDSTSHNIPVYIDKLFSSLESDEIIKAIEAWSYALNGNSNYKIVDLSFDLEYYILNKIIYINDALIILKINSDNAIIYENGFENDVIAFVPKLGSNYIYIIEDRINKIEGVPSESINYQNVVMHEIGHTQGAMHITNDKKNLMFPVTTNTLCVDEKTARQVAEIHGYDLNLMNFCH